MSLKNKCFALLILCCVGCAKKKTEKTDSKDWKGTVILELDKLEDNRFEFNESRFTDIMLLPQNVYYTGKPIPEQYRNLQDLDSFALVTNENSLGIDANTFNLISGYRKGKRVLILDANGDHDFSNDPEIDFNSDFELSESDKKELKQQFPSIKIHYLKKLQSNQSEHIRLAGVYPWEHHPYIYLFDDGLDRALNHFTCVLRLQDYYHGRITAKGVNYEIAVQGYSNEFSVIVVRPDSIKYSPDDLVAQLGFEYVVKDTINLGNFLYRIDSIDTDFTNLYVRKLEQTLVKNRFGKRVGDIAINSSLTNLKSGKIRQVTDFLVDKDYALIYFWGTWCQPCKETTPLIKDFYKKYSDKVNFINVGFDSDMNKVLNYVESQDFGWFQAFVNFKDRNNSIVSQWSVSEFPTIVLINKQSKILYRGGGKILQEIDSHLNRNE